MSKIKQPKLTTKESNSNQDENKQVEIPDMVMRQSKYKSEIETLKKGLMTVGNPLNRVDGRIKEMRKNDTEWSVWKPYKLEEFRSGASVYRGQGLLPTDKTVGVMVIDRPESPTK